jgi:hypothetical protein
MRKQERETKYKRIIEVLKNDPDLSLPQIRERFGISYRKAIALKKEAKE